MKKLNLLLINYMKYAQKAVNYLLVMILIQKVGKNIIHLMKDFSYIKKVKFFLIKLELKIWKIKII